MREVFEKYPSFSEATDETAIETYEFFKNPLERQELFDFSKKIAEYLREENIPNLVIIDRSARPLYIGIKEYLKTRYPDELKPNMYFMNPNGFKAKEEVSDYEINSIIRRCLNNEDLAESAQQVRSKEEIFKEFESVYKKLMVDKDEPLMIFDTCIHSGSSLEPIKKAFDQAGFSDIRVGAINPAQLGAKVKTDFHVTTKRAEKGCYPFDRDRIIEKTFDHVYSKVTNDQKKREKSIELRREIRNIMKDYLAKEDYEKWSGG